MSDNKASDGNILTKIPKVVKVVSKDQVVISAGKREGVKYNDSCSIVEVGEELTDPDTDESLGNYEIIKGKGVVVHVMEKMAVVEFSDSVSNIFAAIGVNKKDGFNNPKIGDEVRF